MGTVVVCGGGVVGLCVSIMLARDGHEVTVLEGDPAAAPAATADAWPSWERKGVAQFRQPHNLLPRFRLVLDREMPEVTRRLVDAGCVWMDLLHPFPPTISDRTSRPGDQVFRSVTGRRPVVESVLAAAAEDEPRVRVRRGVRVAGLLAGPSAAPGTPHVAGVRTATGEQLVADLVVDATGRRTSASEWLAGLPAREPDVRSEDSGFVYYTRYFTGAHPPERAAPVLSAIGSFSLLTIPGDNDTWSVTIVGPARDPALKAVRNPECFSRVVRACPAHAHWLAGTPTTEVLAMAGIVDRYRRYVVDGRPVATGFVAVGDAWACTNPSAGRGASVGLVHAQLLRDVVRAHLGDPLALALAWDRDTEEHVAPFYWNQVEADRDRIAEMNALREGVDPPTAARRPARFANAAMRDAGLFRGLIETAACLALPQQVRARPGVADTIEALGTGVPVRIPGPDRAQLLRLLG